LVVLTAAQAFVAGLRHNCTVKKNAKMVIDKIRNDIFSYKSFFLKINVIITPKSKQATAKPAFAFRAN